MWPLPRREPPHEQLPPFKLTWQLALPFGQKGLKQWGLGRMVPDFMRLEPRGRKPDARARSKEALWPRRGRGKLRTQERVPDLWEWEAQLAVLLLRFVQRLMERPVLDHWFQLKRPELRRGTMRQFLFEPDFMWPRQERKL